jgi:hypothetical protein
MDNFLLFATLPAFEQSLIKGYRSPSHERSVVKHVPMSEVDFIRDIIKSACAGRKVRVRYRGPRKDPMRLHCLRKNAHLASIYIY